DEHDVCVERADRAALRGLDRHLQTIAQLFAAGDLVTEFELHALLLQHLLEGGRDFGTDGRRDLIEEFDNGDFRADAAPDGAQFKANDAGADDNQFLRHLLQRKRAGGADDAFFVDVDVRERRWLAAGGDDDVFGFERLLGTVRAGHFNAAFAGDGAETFDVIDLVLLHQELDAFGEAVDGVVLLLQHLRQIEFDAADLHAHRRERLGRRFEILAGVQQRLRGNAADIEAGAAELAAGFDDRGLEAELAGADGAIVATGAAANDNEIVRHESSGDVVWRERARDGRNIVSERARSMRDCGLLFHVSLVYASRPQRSGEPGPRGRKRWGLNGPWVPARTPAFAGAASGKRVSFSRRRQRVCAPRWSSR